MGKETIFITGASRGIGLELTKQFLRAGNCVVATYRNQISQQLHDLSANENLTLVELDVSNEQSINELSSKIKLEHIDLLINNAGVIGPEQQSRQDVRSQPWLETFAVNTIAPLLVSEALLPWLEKSNNPRILTISSQMGSLNRESTGMYAYRSSKAAVNKVMQVLAIELRDKRITVCPVHPGWVKTDMGGEEADISVEQSAAGILALADKVSFAQSGTFFTWEGEVHDW
ncbi:SDR family oxidoreductase [Vibrio sp. SCSIO 43136]|uniref:SDR family oxidoreductase n=1 Tax=Vibrio sp. SCSIO 43136 TaxID=2819101 RepID=UPI00207596D0|nr:SDR family oxidoreductase [Vibrio sp. SCSIO 43136]USD64046.1 SDR family oxidoreductase [Vibrio sp. SCSIO 43136]